MRTFLTENKSVCFGAGVVCIAFCLAIKLGTIPLTQETVYSKPRAPIKTESTRVEQTLPPPQAQQQEGRLRLDGVGQAFYDGDDAGRFNISVDYKF
jgi:hypothetical protein